MVNPRCPYCNSNVNDLAVQEKGFYAILYCETCGAIYGVVPLEENPPEQKVTPIPQKQKPPPTKSTPTNIRRPTPFDEIGNADLTDKLTPQERLARLKAANMYSGTRYRYIPLYDGPPYCSTHEVEMIKIAVPAGYKNTGRKIWICKQYISCKEWELAE